MKVIEEKIKELLSINEIEPNFNYGENDPNSFDNVMIRQEKLFKTLANLGREHNTLLGRQIKFQCADSYAFYVITKVNANSVQLKWVKYCDAWEDNLIGKGRNVNIPFAKAEVAREDFMYQTSN